MDDRRLAQRICKLSYHYLKFQLSVKVEIGTGITYVYVSDMRKGTTSRPKSILRYLLVYKLQTLSEDIGQ